MPSRETLTSGSCGTWARVLPIALCGHIISKSGVSQPLRQVIVSRQKAADVPKMQCEWLGERVAAPSLRTVVRNALTKEAAGNWGPNATFRFPARDGTGGIWKAVSALLPTERFRLGPDTGAVRGVDIEQKIATMHDGRRIRYQNLVSTMALDGFLHCVEGAKVEKMQAAAKEGLVYSSTIVLGIGIRGTRPERIGDKCMSRLESHTTF